MIFKIKDTRKTIISVLFSISFLWTMLWSCAWAETLKVGAQQRYKTPAAAIQAARDFDLIQIEAGEYINDFAMIEQKHLTIEGILGPKGERPHLIATTRPKNGKAIWVIRGQEITIRNIVFSGARVGDKNGAGIRLEKGSLLLENSYFHHNEMGILTADNPDINLTIRNSEFAQNIQEYPLTGKLSHNIYAGLIHSFILEDSYIHGARYGHNVKSRAASSLIKNNRIRDGEGIGSSYLIDLPNGGVAHIEGNILFQNRDSQNNAMISFGAEKYRHKKNSLNITRNKVRNERNNAIFIRRHFDSDFHEKDNGLPKGMDKQEERWDKKGFFRKLIFDIKKAIK